MLPNGTIVDGKYEVLSLVGKGGMSKVYLALDHHLNKQWAIKEVEKTGDAGNEYVINSAQAEANMMKRLDHPALPRILDILEDDSTILVIMDYIEGRDLSDVLKDYGARPEEDVTSWAMQICDALQYLHSQKPPIIYRDMKPGNVMLKYDGNIKIIDFGIAREYKEKSLTDTTRLGTKGYAPPEQYQGQTDARSDIYALGMTMFNLLTGVDPKDAVSYSVREYNPAFSEGIDYIISKCVEPSPKDRYQSCDELLFDLNHKNELTREYRSGLVKRVAGFAVCAAMAVVMLVTGLVCSRVAVAMNNSDYDNLVGISAASPLNEKVSSYQGAIAIYPDRPAAYELLLEAYEDAGRFDATEAFTSTFEKYGASLDLNDPEVAEILFKAGTMYYNYYSAGGRENVIKAYTYFRINNEEQAAVAFADKTLSACYYSICNFYRSYIFDSASVKEAEKGDYEALISDIRATMEAIQDAGQYEKLCFCNAAFFLMYDQRDTMASVGVDREMVLGLLDEVHSMVQDISVNKEQSKKLQNEILENFDAFRSGIITTYTNKEKGN